SNGAAKDQNGNPTAAAAQFQRLFDSVRPTVTVNQAAGQTDPTQTGPINFTVTFSEPVAGLSASCLNVVSTAGPISTTVTAPFPSGPATVFNVAVSGMRQSGLVTAAVASGCASDAAGNFNQASTSTDNRVSFVVPTTMKAFSVVYGP